MEKHQPNKITKNFECTEKNCYRLISFKSYLDHSNPLFHDLKILNILKINDYLCSLFMCRYKYFNNLPEFLMITLHRIIIIMLEMQTNCMFDIGEQTTQNILFQTME